MNRVPWVRTPEGAAPLRAGDHAFGVLLGWAGPGVTAFVAGSVVRSLPERVAEVAVVVPVGAFFMVAGAVTITPPMLAAAGPLAVTGLRRLGLGGVLPVAATSALAGAVAAVVIGAVAPGTPLFGLLGFGLFAGALRLPRPAAFIALRPPGEKGPIRRDPFTPR